ncbi:MAG: type II toxin-antitoxin system PemK/MazF family toxin [Anaerolineae bacterium]|nr:type II toxin-antitoxin system PemK/MazF family toxin [Anaerolineae bacterium]
MGKFVKGDVVVVPFPFSDLSAAKRRPALIIATLTGDDVILCQITSKAITDSYALVISDSDFTSGGLRQESNIRPNRIFTADANIILYRVGVLSPTKLQEVISKIIQIVTA